MDKKQLKSIADGLECPEKVVFTFVGELADRSGEYTVSQMKVGRGKGGSRLMTLVAEDGSSFVTGTTQSDVILNVVTKDGRMHGFEHVEDVPKVFKTDLAEAALLKRQMVDLVGTTGSKVLIKDTEGEFSGEYTVTSAEKMRGRYGQVKFIMQDSEGNTKQLWSFRHSGIVTEFKVLSIPTQDTMQTEGSNES